MNHHVDVKATASKAALEDEKIAALDFEPWTHCDGEWVPPTNEEWCDAVNPTLIAIRMAWLSLYKSKAELREMLDKMDQDNDDGSNLAIEFLDTIFTRASELVHSTRCLSARWRA